MGVPGDLMEFSGAFHVLRNSKGVIAGFRSCSGLFRRFQGVKEALMWFQVNPKVLVASRGLQ